VHFLAGDDGVGLNVQPLLSESVEAQRSDNEHPGRYP